MAPTPEEIATKAAEDKTAREERVATALAAAAATEEAEKKAKAETQRLLSAGKATAAPSSGTQLQLHATQPSQAGASNPADWFETDLLTLLTVTKPCNPLVIDELIAQGVVSMEDLATHVDGVADWNGFVDAVPGQQWAIRESAPIKSKLKQAWHLAFADFQAQTAGKLKRKVDRIGSPSLMDIDAPIDEDVFDTVKASHQKAYGWRDMDPRRVGNMNMHGRFERQADKNAVDMYPLLRAKSMAQGQCQTAAKKEKFGEKSFLISAGDETFAQRKPTIQNWFICCDLFVNTWGVVGVKKVMYLGKETFFCHWQDVEGYMHEFKKKHMELLGCYDEHKIYTYITSVEEMFRASAIAMSRGTERVPFGTALVKSLKENAHLWERNNYLLGKSFNDLRAHQQHQQAGPVVTPRSSPAQGGITSVCGFYNKGTCKKGASCDFAHTCSVDINGQPCGESHPAVKHKAGKGKGKETGDKKRKKRA